MHGKKSFLALSTAFAALFVGCEWTGSSESDSWSSAYDAMNFSGTYRAVTTATNLSDSEENTQEITDQSFASVSGEKGGSFPSGGQVLSGSTYFSNIVPGSFQASTSGGYAWNDDGNGKLVFTDPNSGAGSSESDSYEVVQKGEELSWKSDTNEDSFDLVGSDVVAGSLVVNCNGTTLKDNGSGVLEKTAGNAATGGVAYDSGAFTLKFSGSKPAKGTKVTVTYKYTVKKDTTTVSSTLSGSGTILYSSGAWTLQIKPAMPSGQSITLSYSYYINNSKKTATYTTISTNTGNEVSAITVSQNGQNLTLTLNNGIVMSGKFTNVQQTGKVNQDTNAGYNTYNAQFQVASTDTKMVGSLNYDLKTGFRMLNGTWTWGKSSYDVQAVGPAWLNSADSSTLSPGVLTK